MEGDAYIATIATSDPNRMLELVAAPDPDVEGAIQITVNPSDDEGVQALGIGFVAEQGERFVGFGERSNSVDQSGWALEHYVADGPYYDAQEYSVMGAVLPPWGTRWRPDTTYFPIPWLLSSRGYGVLIDNDEISYHRVGSESADAWSLEVETTEMKLRVFGGPTPAEALGRYTEAVGRQPSNYAPWFFGPWLQTEEDTQVEEARLADVPTSLNATYSALSPLRLSARPSRQRKSIGPARTTTWAWRFTPTSILRSAPPTMAPFAELAADGALIKHDDGQTYIYDYSSNLGNSFEVSQFDFASASGLAGYKSLTDQAIDHGYDGWMEDFGEYTPLDSVSADGATGTEFHNRYGREYHCGAYEGTKDAGKPSLGSRAPAGLAQRRARPSSGAGIRRRVTTTTVFNRRSFVRYRWEPRVSVLGLGYRRLLCNVRTFPGRRALRPMDRVWRTLRRDAQSEERRLKCQSTTGRSPGIRTICRSGANTRSSIRSSTRTSRPRPRCTTRPAGRSCSTTF